MFHQSTLSDNNVISNNTNDTTTDSRTNVTNTDDFDISISIYILLYSLLMVIAIICCKLLHNHKYLSTIIPEAGMIIMIGIITGISIQLILLIMNQSTQNITNSLFTFSSEVFFVALLPPIICT
jgi:membrane-associated HD superfamily phosphohydrolase